MVISLKIPWKRIFNDLKLPMLFIVVYMTGISVYDHYFSLENIHVPLTLIAVPGTVIALLLAFRTNSAYDRWWEARIIWGAIVNDSRTWVRQLLTFVSYEDLKSKDFLQVKKMAYRHLAWNYAMTSHLRRLPLPAEVQTLLGRKDQHLIGDHSNIPNAILYQQGQDVRSMLDKGLINNFQQIALDNTLSRLTDSMGKCERIKNTVFPSSYSLLVDILIYLWIIFLPFGLVDIIGYVLIPTTISLAFSFLVIDRVAIYMQDPFENQITDTPMLALSRTMEINVKEALNEKSIPEPLKPVHGVLM